MEDNKIYVSEYLALNSKYVEKFNEIEEKIRVDLLENRNLYPPMAEDVYCLYYKDKLSKKEEEQLSLIDSITEERFKADYDELHQLREQIIALLPYIEADPKENLSEN